MGRKALTPNLPQRSQGDPIDPKKTREAWDEPAQCPGRIPGAGDGQMENPHQDLWC